MKEFNIKIGLDNVKVIYHSDFFNEEDSDSVDCPHLEFNGKAISETGYTSHFFHFNALKSQTVEEYSKKIGIKLNNNVIRRSHSRTKKIQPRSETKNIMDWL